MMLLPPPLRCQLHLRSAASENSALEVKLHLEQDLSFHSMERKFFVGL